jgi:hypothetical protein
LKLIEAYDQNAVYLHVILDNISGHNQVLRETALAPTASIREQELLKREQFIKSSSDMLELLKVSKHLTKVEREELDLIIHERVKYRHMQNTVVFVIRNEVSDAILWDALQEYDNLLLRYQMRVKALIYAMHEHGHVEHIKLMYEILVLLAAYIIYVICLTRYFGYIWHLSSRTKLEQRAAAELDLAHKTGK